MNARADPPPLDRELAGLDLPQRRAEWARRAFALLFASAEPVGREAIAAVIGAGAAVEDAIAGADALCRPLPVEIAAVAEGWQLRTRRDYAATVRAGAVRLPAAPEIAEGDALILAAVLHEQPVTRRGLAEVLDKPVGRERLARLRRDGLLAHGPPDPTEHGAYTFVTTDAFLTFFGADSAADLIEAIEAGRGEDQALDLVEDVGACSVARPVSSRSDPFDLE